MLFSARQIPNLLSLSRIPLAALFLISFDAKNIQWFWTSLIFLVVALITDFLDGYIARNWQLATRLGYFIDGIGDKVVYVAILLVIFRESEDHVLLPWLLIAREIILYAVRSIEGGSPLILIKARPISLTYAFFVRLYFLAYFANVAFGLYGLEAVAPLRFYWVFGYLACLCGYIHIMLLVRL